MHRKLRSLQFSQVVCLLFQWPWLKRKTMKRGSVFHLSSICLKHPWNGLLGAQVTLIWGFTLFFLLLFYISLSQYFQMKIVLLQQITGSVIFLCCKQIVSLLFLSIQHTPAAICLSLGGPGALCILCNGFLLRCWDWCDGNFCEFCYLS